MEELNTALRDTAQDSTQLLQRHIAAQTELSQLATDRGAPLDQRLRALLRLRESRRDTAAFIALQSAGGVPAEHAARLADVIPRTKG